MAGLSLRRRIINGTGMGALSTRCRPALLVEREHLEVLVRRRRQTQSTAARAGGRRPHRASAGRRQHGGQRYRDQPRSGESRRLFSGPEPPAQNRSASLPRPRRARRPAQRIHELARSTPACGRRARRLETPPAHPRMIFKWKGRRCRSSPNRTGRSGIRHAELPNPEPRDPEKRKKQREHEEHQPSQKPRQQRDATSDSISPGFTGTQHPARPGARHPQRAERAAHDGPAPGGRARAPVSRLRPGRMQLEASSSAAARRPQRARAAGTTRPRRPPVRPRPRPGYNHYGGARLLRSRPPRAASPASNSTSGEGSAPDGLPRSSA